MQDSESTVLKTYTNEIWGGMTMGLFDLTDDKLQALYHRAWLECNRGFVNPRKYPYLDRALIRYAIENDCSYDDALIFAKTGKRLGRLNKKP